LEKTPSRRCGKVFSRLKSSDLAKEIDGTAFRLGADVSALRAGSLADDTDMLDRRAAHAERAIDGLRKKFGDAAVIRGIAYNGPEKAQAEE
jgi:DNA polymerase-4